MTVRVWGCARHAQIGVTCCQKSEILLTDGDKARISAHTGDDGFWEVRAPHDPVYRVEAHERDGWALGFYPDGTRPVTKRKPNGDCTFLGHAGCVLPLDVRPIVCRLYPYSFDDERITGVEADRCPLEVVRPGGSIVEELGMDPAIAEDWRSQLYSELREAPRRPVEG